MRIFKQHSGYFPKVFIIFFLMMTLLSIAGGFQLSQLVYRITNLSLQRTDQLMAIEEGMDDAAIALGQQIQEWKDMLLRADDAILYSKHRKAFLVSSVGVQEALLRTKMTMLKEGMNAGEIDLLSIEHKTLVSNYLHAQANLNLHRIESSYEVDKQVIGVDRNLQQHISTVKANIENTATMQLSGTIPTHGMRYMMVGLLGTCSLWIMAMLGFAFASFIRDRDTGAAANFSSIYI